MRLRKILSAALKMKNFALLAAILITFYLTGYVPFVFIGLAGYVYFVLQTLKDERFVKEYSKKEKQEVLEKMNQECSDLFLEVKHSLSKYEEKKIIEVLKEKDEIIDSYFEDEKNNNENDAVRQKIAEQVLNLVTAYIRLVCTYSVRSRDLARTDINEAVDRINNNSRKMGFIRDPAAAEDLRKALEMDQSIVGRVQEQKNELEKTSARLDYIESTISMFKHRFISRENSDETSAEIETVMNEAVALDNVLNSSRDKLNL